ncbi:hypothetical protein IE989_28550 [Klebsiella pneumoniae]|nr:hypothetical protein [Klebsiella pneumoniae]
MGFLRLLVAGLSSAVRAGQARWSLVFPRSFPSSELVMLTGLSSPLPSLGGLQFSLKGHKTVLLKIARRKAGKDYTQQFSSGTTLAT